MQKNRLIKQFLLFLLSSHQDSEVEESISVFSSFTATTEVLHCKKNDFVFQQGDKVTSLWFVAHGLLRYVAVSEDGKEFTKHFALAPGLVGSTRASTLKVPSQFSVQALCDCLLLQVDWQSFRQLLSSHPVISAAYAGTLEQLFIKKEQREYDFVLKSAEQRYLDFQHEFADVMRDIPLQYIASYIGITPVALSRIRKRLL